MTPDCKICNPTCITSSRFRSTNLLLDKPLIALLYVVRYVPLSVIVSGLVYQVAELCELLLEEELLLELLLDDVLVLDLLELLDELLLLELLVEFPLVELFDDLLLEELDSVEEFFDDLVLLFEDPLPPSSLIYTAARFELFGDSICCEDIV